MRYWRLRIEDYTKAENWRRSRNIYIERFTKGNGVHFVLTCLNSWSFLHSSTHLSFIAYFIRSSLIACSHVPTPINFKFGMIFCPIKFWHNIMVTVTLMDKMGVEPIQSQFRSNLIHCIPLHCYHDGLNYGVVTCEQDFNLFIHFTHLAFIHPFLHSNTTDGDEFHGHGQNIIVFHIRLFVHSIHQSFIPSFQRSVLNATDGDRFHGHGQNIIVFHTPTIQPPKKPDVNIALGSVHTEGRRKRKLAFECYVL